MTCQDALRHGLAGGPMPAEAREHVRACPACARELSALRAVESRLAGAAPPALLPVGLERRVLARVRRRRRFDWAAIPAAAALLTASALLTAWLLLSSAPPSSSPPAAWPQISAEESALPAVEDTTANLLQAYDSLNAPMGDVEPEEIQEVLSPTEQGGWNG